MGRALQEVIVPILRVGKQREADVGKVEVQIIVPGRSLISSGQTAVTFYQAQPVSENCTSASSWPGSTLVTAP